MPFLTLEFAFFFVGFFAFYWRLRAAPSVQNELLIVVSLGLLAMVNVFFVLAVVGFTLWVGFVAERVQGVRARCWLWVGIAGALLNLGFFKYFDALRPLLLDRFDGNVVDLMLPLGLSYYTFQGIAYLVTLYREQRKPRPALYSCRLSWSQLLLYCCFFPTITAGPIARVAPVRYFHGQHVGMAVQIKTIKRRVILRPALALSLVLLGVIKTWWFAGAIAVYWVVPVFDNPLQYDRATLLLAIYGYTLELFFNFSGYTDLVIGLAMLLGFQLPPNFDRPLCAVNIRDFWNRWHMTLSTWIRDYIYIPLGGSRRGFVRTQINVLVAMVLSGLWHGNGWPFLLWGLLHGVALMLLNMAERFCGRQVLFGTSWLARAVAVLLTLSFVAAAFVFFRAARLDDAWLMFTALSVSTVSLDWGAIAVLALLLLALVSYGGFVRLFVGFVALLEALPVWLWVVPLALVLMVLVVCAPSGIPGFIYANF